MFRPIFDPTYLLVLVGALLSIMASAKVKSTYARYARVGSRTGMTGADAARRILNSQGIYDVSVQQVAGELTDHYDPSAKVLRLSSSTYGSTSVAALGVAAAGPGVAEIDVKQINFLRREVVPQKRGISVNKKDIGQISGLTALHCHNHGVRHQI